MVKVGTKCLLRRYLFLGSPVDHEWEDTVVKLTATRAYFTGGKWFALGDPEREVKPKYLDYHTHAVLHE